MTKNQKAVRCNTCQLWVHADCQGITKELYAYLKNPGSVGGTVAWNCDCCSASATRLQARVVALETDLGKIEARMLRNEGNALETERKVEKMVVRQDKLEEKMGNERV